jgi:preprotein translocase subunit SecG
MSELMLLLQGLQASILVAIVISLMMIGTVIFIIFYHDSKHDEIDRWIDFSFSGNSLRDALGYYRFMAVSMLFFYILFTCSCLYLQYDGFKIFANKEMEPVFGGPIATSLFALDLVFRGGFFDVMEHFDLRMTSLFINKGAMWFWIYSFVFRIFYGLTLIKMFISFTWIYGKIRLARRAHGETAKQLKLFE